MTAIKTLLAATALAAAPGMAFAMGGCDYVKPQQTVMSCAAGTVLDAATGTCVTVATS